MPADGGGACDGQDIVGATRTVGRRRRASRARALGEAAEVARAWRRSPPRRRHPHRWPSRARRRSGSPVRASRGRARRGRPPTVLRVPNQSEITAPSHPHSSPEHLGQQPVVLAAVRAVEPVVGRHDRPRARRLRRACSNGSSDTSRNVRSSTSLDTSNRSSSASLATRCLTHAATPPSCSAADVRDGEVRGQHRILRHALEVAATERVALEVHGRRQQHVRTLGARLCRQRGADACDEVDVPTGAERSPAREPHRGRPTDE